MSLSSMKTRATLMTTLEKVEEKKQVEENTKTGDSTSQTPGREQRAQSNGVIEDSSLKQSFTKVWTRLKKTNKKEMVQCSVQQQHGVTTTLQPDAWQEGAVTSTLRKWPSGRGQDQELWLWVEGYNQPTTTWQWWSQQTKYTCCFSSHYWPSDSASIAQASSDTRNQGNSQRSDSLCRK